MIGISIANSLGFTGPSVLPDASSQAYFAATGITGVTQQTAINNLVKGLKADGIWSKMKAVYPFVTDNRNLLSYTEDFINGYWNKTGGSAIVSNTTIAPNGTTTADTFITASGSITNRMISSTLDIIGQTVCVSIYAKSDTFNRIKLTNNASNVISADFNLDAGTLIGTTGSVISTSISSVGNGWYRCSMSYVATDATVLYRMPLITSGISSSIFVWGAQLELGSTATTYQPIATTQQAFIASQFKFNLVNPVDSDAAFRLVFNGGWTHSSNGATPNGTNGYADTKLVPSTNGFTTSNGHISFYSRNTNVNGLYPVDLGVDQTGTGLNVSQKMSSVDSLSYHGRAYAQVITGVDSNNISGLHTITRTSTTSLKYNRNGSLIQTNSTLETGVIPTVALFIGSTNNNGSPSLYSTRQAAFASIGDGLLDSEATALYNRVQNFQLALNRAV
jgi:hypothetical protein